MKFMKPKSYTVVRLNWSPKHGMLLMLSRIHEALILFTFKHEDKCPLLRKLVSLRNCTVWMEMS